MNCNNICDEELQNSEAWLAEQIFTQLKDFIENEKKIDKFEVRKRNEQTESPPRSVSIIDADILDLGVTSTSTPMQRPQHKSSINEVNQQSLNFSKLPEEEKYDVNLFKFVDPPSFYPHIVKCANCNCIFEGNTFYEHICDYDEHNNLICPEPNEQHSATPFEPGPVEPPCMRLLRENQIRIRRFLKDELKYDLNTTVNTSGTSNGSKKQDGPHECNLCERKFVHASGLLRHMEKHALDLIPNPASTMAQVNNGFSGGNGLRVVIKCTFCGRLFFEAQTASQHFCIHFPDYLEEETFSEAIEFPYESYLDDAVDVINNEISNSNNKPNTHLKMVILSCVLQCEFCDLIFSEVSFLFAHSACHRPERRFECSSCEIRVGTSKEIFLHWQSECVFSRENVKRGCSLQRYYVCNVCENKFGSLESLHEHRYAAYHFFPRGGKQNTLLLPCEYCDCTFASASEIVEHYEQKHVKKTKREPTAKLRQYLCDICGKTYTQSSHLWQHLRFHKGKCGVKPFACKEPGCCRKFTIRPDLNDHIRKCHTGERPYHCLICGRRFLTGSVFYQHRLIHRGERRYGCDECGKRFYRADALKNHQRIHTGEKPYGCLFCTKYFRQRGDRDKHIRARHSSLDANARLMMQIRKMHLEASARAANNKNSTTPAEEVLMLGNIAFPKSMFNPLLADIDASANISE